MPQKDLIPHLFRTEFAKIVAVLCKTYGLANVQLAEDLASETFLIATETWGLKGIPDNPTAWLYHVAKNKAKDHFKHLHVFRDKVTPALKQGQVLNSDQLVEIDLSESNIQDSQLQMLFAVCNPLVSNEAQIAMALRVLCGFGVDEIASALLTSKSTINKRLFRTKEKFREERIKLKLPDKNEIENRLNNVLSILYLLYNEGYYSTTVSTAVRRELCFESMRLLLMLIDNKETSVPAAPALMALFCFHASRFDARLDADGQLILYADQDKTKWDVDLIERGVYYLNLSADGNIVSKYHLEASIAFWHTQKNIDEKKKWYNILQLYNRLLQIEYSPVAALNRTYALFKAEGREKALKEAQKISLGNSHLYHSLLAELYEEFDIDKRRDHLKRAYDLAETETDKSVIARKMKT